MKPKPIVRLATDNGFTLEEYMGSIVDYNTFGTLRLLKESISWYKKHNQTGQFNTAITIDTNAYNEYLTIAQHKM